MNDTAKWKSEVNQFRNCIATKKIFYRKNECRCINNCVQDVTMVGKTPSFRWSDENLFSLKSDKKLLLNKKFLLGKITAIFLLIPIEVFRIFSWPPLQLFGHESCASHFQNFLSLNKLGWRNRHFWLYFFENILSIVCIVWDQNAPLGRHPIFSDKAQDIFVDIPIKKR